MDFDSSLFDLPFEDLASLSVEPQQQQGQSGSVSPLDFQDFCSEFAGSDFSADLSAPAWFPEPTSVPVGSPTNAKEADATMKAEDLFLDGLDKAAFDPLGFDSSYQGMFNYGSPNGDAQVVPDMTPVEANAADFTLPTFSQTPAAPKSTSTGQLPAATMPPPTQPYSWMNGLDYSSFGWPVRARLPSDPAARQQSLSRYRDKKARRFNNSTKVRYEMRKVNADKRPRIKGRFVKPEELQSYLKSMPAAELQ